MGLVKSHGQMYPWVSHCHSHLAGECPHSCSYCYVDNPRFGRPERYKGPLRLIEKEFNVKYGTGKTIFIEHCNDLFAETVPTDFIIEIFKHCAQFPENTYVFQSKNPSRFFFLADGWPPQRIFGTTIESNRWYPYISQAPPPEERMKAMEKVMERKFLTIEPVLDFDVEIMADWINRIKPEFLNLGADSKGHNLPEPSVEKIMALVAELEKYGIELREKHNLQRLKAK